MGTVWLKNESGNVLSCHEPLPPGVAYALEAGLLTEVVPLEGQSVTVAGPVASAEPTKVSLQRDTPPAKPAAKRGRPPGSKNKTVTKD